jgi:hypothetical protein
MIVIKRGLSTSSTMKTVVTKMTISFEVMMRALVIQFSKPHYIHIHRGFLTLDHVQQFDLKIILTEEFQDQEFNSVHDFSKKTNKFIESLKKESVGYRKEELSAMKRILLHSTWEIENEEKRINAEIEKERLLAIVADEDEDFIKDCK